MLRAMSVALLRSSAAARPRDSQLGARHQKGGFRRSLDRVAECANTTGKDGDLVHGIHSRESSGDNRVAHLMVGHHFPLVRVEHAAPFLEAGDDTFDCGVETLLILEHSTVTQINPGLAERCRLNSYFFRAALLPGRLPGAPRRKALITLYNSRTEAAMPLNQLSKTQWQAYFDRFSRALGAKQVKIEVTGLGLGHQVEADYIPLTGISYDPKDDVLGIFAEKLEHVVSHPKEMYVDRDVDWVHSIEVVDSDGDRHIITLKDPLKLPELVTSP